MEKINGLNSKHIKVLDAIFSDPIRADVKWNNVEGLLEALGAFIEEGRGSRVRVIAGERFAVFHKPHGAGEKAMDKGAVKSLRRFMKEAGLWPSDTKITLDT